MLGVIYLSGEETSVAGISMKMWTKEVEQAFFHWALIECRCDPNLLFYEVSGRHLFYLPVGVKGKGEVKQGRNPLVGEFTEVWAKNFLQPIVGSFGLHLVRKAVVPEWGLIGQRAVDLAICLTSEKHQKPENIVALVEVKMSIVWNWEWHPSTGAVTCVGDFRTHQGRPSVLRRDGMLKMLGKVAMIRGMEFEGAFVVLCNTSIPTKYHEQIDGYKRIGVVQGFFSVNPQPIDGKDDGRLNPKRSPLGGFLRWDTPEEATETMTALLD